MDKYRGWAAIALFSRSTSIILKLIDLQDGRTITVDEARSMCQNGQLERVGVDFA